VRVLLDTCILAEVRKPDGDVLVKAAVSGVPDEGLFLSVLTIGEINKGIGLLATGNKKLGLMSWLNGLLASFTDRILSVDCDTARLWGEITARAQNKGIVIPAIDALIAATALQHGMHVMTRNTRHFEATGAMVIDPWKNDK
jgi:toxin FitB